MKHFLFLLLAPTPTLFAQNVSLNDFIAQHKQEQGFTYAFLSKELLEVTVKSDLKNEDWNGLQNVVKNIGSLSILAADSTTEGPSLYKQAKSLINPDDFETLLTVRDESTNVRVWVKSEDALVTDLILLIGAPDAFVLACFTGNLELGNLAELATLFEAGKVEQLARSSEAVAIDFEISPNPSNGSFTLTYSNEQDPPSQMLVMDQSGRQIATISLYGTPSQSMFLGDLNSGIYWIQVKTQQGKLGIKQLQIVR